VRKLLRGLVSCAALASGARDLLAQGTIPGLTSTPINFAGHADAFVSGPDGNVWIVDSTANAVGRLAVDGSSYQAFPAPTASAGLQSIAAGADGNLWFTETSVAKVGRVTPSGTITEFALPTNFRYVLPILVASGSIFPGPDGDVWISGANQMARVTLAGAATVVAVPSPAPAQTLTLGKCVVGSDDNFWCQGADIHTGDYIARITTAGAATAYPSQGQPFDLTLGADGNVWFVSQQGLAQTPMMTRLKPDGSETVYALPFTNFLTAGIAAGADGNIWFTEHSSPGTIWQMILSSATDDGHATFNSASVNVETPDAIVPVPGSARPSGSHTEGAANGGCPAGAAFFLGSQSSIGGTLTWVKTAAPTTCTDMVARGAYRRGRVLSVGAQASCSVKPRPMGATIPQAASDATLTLEDDCGELPNIDSFAGWAACERAAGGIQCTSSQLEPGQTFTLFYTLNQCILSTLVTITCASSTAEITPADNQLTIDAIVGIFPSSSRTADVARRGVP
jgi:streptogramin lyase